MAATISRHHGNYARPQKTLPISMSAKSSSTYNHPVSRVAMSPPELSDTSTVYSSRRSGGTLSEISDDCESRYPTDINVMDQVSERMENLWNPTNMDKMIAGQAKTSGTLNAKNRELDDARARLAKRMQRSRVNFEDMVEQVAEARADIKASTKTLDAVKAKAAKIDPNAREEARRSRQTRR